MVSICHSHPQSPTGLGGGVAESLQLSLPTYRDFHKVETFHRPPQITIASGALSTSKEEVRVWLRWMKGTQRNVKVLRGQGGGGGGGAETLGRPRASLPGLEASSPRESSKWDSLAS